MNASRKFLVILPCLTGSISLICSLLVIVRILRFRKSLLKKAKERLILGLCLMDIFFSAGCILSTFAGPSYLVKDERTRDDFAQFFIMGTRTSCNFQGWLYQLGSGAPLYNACLCLYYYLSICHRMQDEVFFIWIEPTMHTFIWVWGIVSASVAVASNLIWFGGYQGCFLINVSGWNRCKDNPELPDCHLKHSLNTEALIGILTLLPNIIAIVAVVCFITLVYCRVRTVEQRAQRWSFQSTIQDHHREQQQQQTQQRSLSLSRFINMTTTRRTTNNNNNNEDPREDRWQDENEQKNDTTTTAIRSVLLAVEQSHAAITDLECSSMGSILMGERGTNQIGETVTTTGDSCSLDVVNDTLNDTRSSLPPQIRREEGVPRRTNDHHHDEQQSIQHVPQLLVRATQPDDDEEESRILPTAIERRIVARQQEEKDQRQEHMMRRRRSSRRRPIMTAAVSETGIQYVVGYLITYIPTILQIYLSQVDYVLEFHFLVAITLPLQGFWNWLFYTRGRLRVLRERQQEQQQSLLGEEETMTRSTRMTWGDVLYHVFLG